MEDLDESTDVRDPRAINTDGEEDNGRRSSTRRNVLGLLAASAVVVACGESGESGELTVDQLSPSTTAGDGGTAGPSTTAATRSNLLLTVDVTTEPVFETGADLGRATLPTSPDTTAAPTTTETSPAETSPNETSANSDASGSTEPAPSPTAADPAPASSTTSSEKPAEVLVVTDEPAPTTAAPQTKPSSTTTVAAAATTATMAAPALKPPTTKPPATTAAPATKPPATSAAPATAAPTTKPPATAAPTTKPPATTAAPTTAAPTTAAPATTAPSPNNAPAVLTAETAVAKLTFGPTPGQIKRARAMGPKAFIEDQLRRTTPDGRVEQQVQTIEPIHMSPAELRSNRIRNWWMHNYVGHVAIYRASRSESQLYEMMGQLWMDHFNVYLDDNYQYFIPDYQENVIRRHAMGSFKELFKAVAHSAAMLFYLNNAGNDASTPETINENYGRELLELHSLGIDENNRQIYNESDVETAAMIMAGWSTELNLNDPNYGQFLYRPDYEYRGGDRTLLNGAWSSAGLSGKARGDSLLEFLATHPATARHIAYKMCRRFVSDRPSAALVNSTAQVFLANDTAIVPTLRHIFESAEFAGSGGQKVRRPLEFQAALLRATTSTFSSVGEDMSWRRLGGYYLQPAGHEPWQWELPDGYPDEAEEWIVADALIARWNHAIQVADKRVGGVETDLEPLLKSAGGSTIGEAAQGIAAELGIGPLADDVVAANVAAVGYTPDRPMADVDRGRLGPLVGLLIAHPLFQTR